MILISNIKNYFNIFLNEKHLKKITTTFQTCIFFVENTGHAPGITL